jgi:2-phosphosulfolactate phosphatase
MKIETILTPAELPALAQRDLRATACVVFDVLRATSTFVTALHHGAQAIIPVSEIAEALEIKKAEARSQKPELILLGGERNGVRISADGIDFDLGNSPREYTPEIVRGKTIVSTTTNGTRALRACVGAKIILAASFLNLAATAKFLQQNKFAEVLLVCAGTGEGVALEDVLAAGALAEILLNETLTPALSHPMGEGENYDARLKLENPTGKSVLRQRDDATEIARRSFSQAQSNLAEVFSSSQNARRLLVIPELRDDVEFCLRRDIFDLVAEMGTDGALRKVN